MEFLNDLNSVQREAATQISGPVMIIAGAGSGKTRVLTYRVAYLLNQGIDPFRILALTFTNKAAREMTERIGKMGQKYSDETMKVLKISFLSSLALELAATISVAVIAVEIGLRLVGGHMQFSSALMILILAPEIYFPLRNAAALFHASTDGTEALTQLNGIPTENEVTELSSDYPKGLQFWVGPSGAGKTTVISLIPRLYDVTGGSISIGGVDIREFSLTELRNQIGVVTQDAHLFHDTIEANLRYAKPDATFEQLREACELAQIWELVSSLPDGLNTMVGERGYRLSGGEKARLAIARLILKDPKIVLLDEATAHLDAENEALVQLAFKEVLKNRTSIVIAHRLSTVRDADQILVLDQGTIVERGNHETLMGRKGLYSELYQRQFSS